MKDMCKIWCAHTANTSENKKTYTAILIHAVINLKVPKSIYLYMATALHQL